MAVTSALISFLRTLLFQVAAVLVLPTLWGIDGIWLAIAAELAALAVSVCMFVTKDKKVPLSSRRVTRKAAGCRRPFSLFECVLHELAVFDAEGGVLLIGHIAEVGAHDAGDAVVGDEKVGLALVGF